MKPAAETSVLPRGLASIRIDPAAAGAWLLPFALIVYLALKGGGYDTIVRGEVGIAVWWILLLGALVSVLPITQLGRPAWVALGLLAGFGAWTALGIAWSESAERSAGELARVATHLGVLALALAVVGRRGVRHALGGITAAVVVVGALALLSRLHPDWFPANDAASFLPGTRSRLNYPFNYWNALAAFVAMGLPLVLGTATSARSLAIRSLAAAALPMLALTAFFTLSRGGAVAAVVGLIAFLLLAPDRLTQFASLSLGAIGSAILIAAAAQRQALEDGLLTSAARQQGDEMLALVVLVCAGVGLLHAGIGLALRYGGRPRLPRIGPKRTRVMLATGIAVAAVSALVAGLPGELSDRWQEFKQPGLDLRPGEQNRIARFESASGNGRYQYWRGALDATASDPFKGTGPGTFEYWWAREGTLPGFIRDAHSLYLEALAELGVVGLLLLGAFFVWVLTIGVWGAMRAPPAKRRLLAAATAACAAFTVSAGIDWVWEVAALPVTFLVIAATVVATGSQREPSHERQPTRLGRGVFVALALPALVAIALPLASSTAVRGSQEAADSARLGTALGKAQTAARIQPYAATPQLQRGLVLELRGDLRGAAAAVRSAVGDEPTNWRVWLVLSRVEAHRGNASASFRAYRKAKSLNPRSPLFSR